MPNDAVHRESPGHAYFDVDGDLKQLSQSESEDGLSITWRGDPNETGADAAIVVVTNELNAVTYYVHKSVICFGKSQSKYLANALMQASRNPNDVEKQKMQSVKIELDQRDAENVPIFLDFIYSHYNSNGKFGPAPLPDNGTMDTVSTSNTNFSSLSRGLKNSSSTESEAACSFVEGGEINTNNAVSLRHLARRFENDALTRAVNRFIQKDLNFKTGPLYLYKAWEYKDERLMDSAQRLCAENIEQIDKKALIRLPVNLFRVVIKSLESFEKENKDVSLFLSEVVCRYLEKHPKERTAKLILELTDPLLMPYIASEAAIGYTAIVKDLESNDAAHHWNDLVRLCKRCAEAVVREYGWSDFSVDAAVDEYLGKHKTGNSTTLQQSAVDSLLFATSFAAALEQAQDDYEEILDAHKQMIGLIDTLSDSATLMESVQQRKDEYIEQQRIALERATEEIVKLRRQVNELKQQQLEHPNPQQQQPEQDNPSPQLQQPKFYSSPQQKRSHPAQPFNGPRPPPHQQLPRSQSPQYERPRQPSQQQQQHPQQRPRQILPAIHQQPPHPRMQPRSSPAPMARHRHPQDFVRQHQPQQQQQSTESPDSRPDLLEMKYAPPPPIARSSIVSPTQVGQNVHENKNRARQELRTKSEMRARSLLV